MSEPQHSAGVPRSLGGHGAAGVATNSREKLPLRTGEHDAADAEDLTRLESDLLAQTSQIVSQVREQLADVTRREQLLRSQLVDLESERRAFRLERQQFADQTAETRAQLEARRQAFAAEGDELKQQRAELTQHREDFDRDRQRLAAERAHLRDELESAVAQERIELRAALAAAEAERLQLNESRQLIEQQQVALNVEIEQRRSQLEVEWSAERQRLLAELTEAALSEQLRTDRQQLEVERQHFRQVVDDWQDERTQAESELRRQRDRFDEERHRAERELADLRLQAWEDLNIERREHERRLLADRQALDEERQCVERELQKQHALLESRNRFQQDHLNRAKTEIEKAHHVLRLEYQQSRQRLETLLNNQRRQTRQLDRRRAILEEFAESLSRQQDALARLQESINSTAQHEQQRLAAERQAWEIQVQAQAAEHQRQTDLVSLHTENLEARRVRLDRLREELEERHRILLETKMSVDEAWAQLAQVTGDEQAQQRVDRSRDMLADYFRMLRDGLTTQRRELEDERDLFVQQKDDFRLEQQNFTDWIAQREHQIRRQEESLAAQHAELNEQEVAWQRARDNWLAERLDAERIIRQLLTELSSSIDEVSDSHVVELQELPNLLGMARFLENAA